MANLHLELLDKALSISGSLVFLLTVLDAFTSIRIPSYQKSYSQEYAGSREVLGRCNSETTSFRCLCDHFSLKDLSSVISNICKYLLRSNYLLCKSIYCERVIVFVPIR